MRDPVLWSAIFTAVIAIETGVYVWLTRRLWKQTKAAAEAAKISADAAKLSAETVANVYRPVLGVSQISIRPNPRNAAEWMIDWKFKNYGTLPAVHVDARLEWSVGVGFGGPAAGPNSAEIFPQAEIETPVLCRISLDNQRKVLTGDQKFEVNVTIKYAAPDGRSFTHTAYAQWDHETAAFTILKSNTSI